MTLAIATKANTTQAASNTVAATAPASIASGDILLAWVSKNTTTAPSTVPSGWALATASGAYRAGFIAAQALSGNIGTGWGGFYWKEAGGSEPGTYTWGVASGTPTWDGEIFRITGFAGQKPGGIIVPAYLFSAAKINTRSSTTITSGAIPQYDLAWDRYLCIYSVTQTVAGVTTNLSALSGSLTQDSYNAQTGISTLTAHEYIDLATSMKLGTRGVTTDQSTGGTGGYMLLLADPSALTGIGVKKRHIRPRYGKNRMAA